MPYDTRLHARPSNMKAPAPSGLYKLDVGSRRDSYFYVPQQYHPARPAPLVLLLHGQCASCLQPKDRATAAASGIFRHV